MEWTISSNIEKSNKWKGRPPIKRSNWRISHQVVDKETRSIVLTHLSEKNNLPHLAESTVLYHLDELFQGDIAISMQDGPDFSHHIGQYEKETNPDRGLVLRG